MKTGFGRSKCCIPQPFTHCLISLCSSLFDFDYILNILAKPLHGNLGQKYLLHGHLIMTNFLP